MRQEDIVNNNGTINNQQTLITQSGNCIPIIKSYKENETLETYYQVRDLIGSGGFANVYSGFRRRDGLPVAIKHVMKESVTTWTSLSNGQSIPAELYLLHRVQHVPGVIKLLDTFETPDSFHLVMERPENVKDLYDYITEQGPLSENVSRNFFTQIVQIVWNIEKSGVLHRDIKDENVLVDLNTGQLRLIDFGCGTLLRDTEFDDYDGTRVYSPPEWLSNSLYNGRQATVWSLGILLFDLVNGDIPFEEDHEIKAAHLHYKTDTSTSCRDLIRKCLSVDPAQRPTLEVIMSHPWMTKAAGVTETTFPAERNNQTDKMMDQSILRDTVTTSHGPERQS